jgi:hypothetical protein
MASPAKLRYDGSIVHCRTMPVRRRFAMLLPLVSVIAASRTGRVIAGVAWVLVVAAFVVTPVLADDQPDPYTATVKVDATADSAAAARTIARTDGQRRALMEVLERVSGSADLSKLPKLDDQTITDMVDSFEVANEKMSTVRYLADYTFHFHPAKVRRLLRSANIAIAEAPAKPVVVVPVYRNAGTLTLWDDPNPWREAWNQVPLDSGPIKFTLPLGGIGDLSAIDAEQAREGDPEALTTIAQRNGGDEALVALATARKTGDQLTGLDVTLTRYRLGRQTDTRSDSIDANPGESPADFFKRAVGVVIADIEHGGPPAAAKETSLSATVPISSLDDWVALQRRLIAVPGIRAVDLVSLNRHQAKVVIKFAGKTEQLKASLGEADLDLSGADPDWQLLPGGAAKSN